MTTSPARIDADLPAAVEGQLTDLLTRRDVEQAVSRAAYQRAQEYVRQRRVISVAIFDRGTRVEARVQGHAERPYDQAIRLEAAPGGVVRIKALCNCPMGYNCKHSAATLLSIIGQRHQDAAPAAGIAPGPQGTPTHAVPRTSQLAPHLATWLDALARAEKQAGGAGETDLRERIIYVLSLARRHTGAPGLMVTPTVAWLLKGGKLSEKSRRLAFNAYSIYPPYVRLVDREIIALLPPSGALAGSDAPAALARVIATGRARWDGVLGKPVLAGPKRQGRIAWRVAEDATLRLAVELDGEAGAGVVDMAPPHYVETATGVIGPIETGHAPLVAEQLLAAPPVSPQQAPLLRAALAERLPALAGVEPPAVAPPERVTDLPVPCLTLTVGTIPAPDGDYSYGWDERRRWMPEGGIAPVARLAFRYGAATVAVGDPRELPTFLLDGRGVEVERRPKTERKALRRLDGFGLSQLIELRRNSVPVERSGDFVRWPEDGEGGWYDFLYSAVPTLRGNGWQVEVAADFPIRLLRADGPVDIALDEASGIDWFELQLGVTLDGERVDLVPALLSLLAQQNAVRAAPAEAAAADRPLFVRLADGRVLGVPAARLRPILDALTELFAAGAIDPAAKRIGFSPIEAPGLADLEAAAAETGASWRGGERLRELGRLLRTTGGIPVARLPGGFAGELRPYQARGVDWLQFLRAAGLGGVLADDMGLGKTVQTLAHLAIEQAEGRLDRPALVVAPTSLVPNWRREAARFAPGLKVLVLHGAERKALFGEIAAHDLVITTYPLLARDQQALTAQSWHLLVLDEAQTIKNPDATTTRLARQLEARHRLCLTGTPLENHLGELWSLFAFLSPGFLGDKTSFARRWRTPIEKRGDTMRRRLLAGRVRPFLLRRTKAEVATDLPPKTEMVEAVEMEAAQRDLYESVRLAMHKRVREAIAASGLARSRIIVLDALLKLRQVCCDPRLLKLESVKARRAGSAKLERLMSMLPSLLEDGRRILLFSQFTSMLALIEAALAEAGIAYVLLTGDTRDRETPIRRFQSGEVPLFLISLKAGGLGLNLTAADTVIHYDPWWNPAVEDQATDRAHRIGQDKAVFVYKLTMLASIEEKMETLKAKKRELAAGLFDPEAGSTLGLTESDVEALFAEH